MAEAGRRGDHVVLAVGREAMLDRAPPKLSEGAALLVEIVREAIPEPGRAKRARAISAAPDAIPASGPDLLARITATGIPVRRPLAHERSEEHTSELQSLMRISYAVFCLKNKKTTTHDHDNKTSHT